jgi:cysteine desulfurase
LNNIIYFDNAATHPPFKSAITAFADTARTNYGNPSNAHSLGLDAENALETARAAILAKFYTGVNNIANNIVNNSANNGVNNGDNTGELYFTSGATESDNIALVGAANALKRRGNKIISSGIEHPAVYETLEYLRSEGFNVVRVNPDMHSDFTDKILAELDKETILVSCMDINNETGYNTNTSKLYSEVKAYSKDVVVHVDSAQGFLKLPSVGDLISVSAHKVGGVKGIGALFVRKGVRLLPRTFGGGQQKGIRPGTLPTELAVSFAAAATEYTANTGNVSAVYNTITDGLKHFPNAVINSFNNLPHILNFSLVGAKSEVLVNYLSEQGIMAANGSACSAKGNAVKRHRVLSAFGLPQANIDSAVRVSFSNANTVAEANTFLSILETANKKLSRLK